MFLLIKASNLLRDINVLLAENVIVSEQTGTRQEKQLQLVLVASCKLGLLQLSSCPLLEKFYPLKQLSCLPLWLNQPRNLLQQQDQHHVHLYQYYKNLLQNNPTHQAAPLPHLWFQTPVGATERRKANCGANS